jgi:ribosomal protein S18 acetylase RimI-like enzyme
MMERGNRYCAGEFNIAVQKEFRRRGIGTALLKEAIRRFKVDLEKQEYTRNGAALANRFHERGQQ